MRWNRLSRVSSEHERERVRSSIFSREWVLRKLSELVFIKVLEIFQKQNEIMENYGLIVKEI